MGTLMVELVAFHRQWQDSTEHGIHGHLTGEGVDQQVLERQEQSRLVQDETMIMEQHMTTPLDQVVVPWNRPWLQHLWLEEGLVDISMSSL